MSIRYCRSCKRETIWKKAKALVNTWWASLDFGDEYSGQDLSKVGRGQTISQTGKAVLVTVDKCERCGRSIGPDMYKAQGGLR
jgi:hypothetical protein